MDLKGSFHERWGHTSDVSWQTLVPASLHEDVRWCIDASRKEAQRSELRAEAESVRKADSRDPA